MILALTAKLIAVPELAWPRLVAAVDAEEPLPPPLGHACALAAISVVATLFGSALAPGHTAASVVSHTLAATAGYVGASAAVVLGLPKALAHLPAVDAQSLARYGAASMLPLALSGVFNLVPMPGLSVLWTLGAAALAARSAFLGASQFLALEGNSRRNAAAMVVILGSTPILLSLAFRIFIIP
ncbi:MAG: hypothetical protein GW913_06305 [Myxococcales bacterium]|nr:hypothetical protein [Myxococcales bacterium]